MKEKIENMKQIFEEIRDQIHLLASSELQQDILMLKLDKLEELAEELEFLCEEVA
jgi:hypothetical protein